MPRIPYSKPIEKQMKTLFDNLSERDRRMYAPVEVSKLDHGGLKYICDLLVCSDNTVYHGWRNLLEGEIYTRQAIEVYDHDFPYLAEGVAIPHGIYDINLNVGYVNIGTSRDTSEFACDSLRHWWYNRGRYDYSEATQILILVDCGGSNGYRHYVFKKALQELANRIGLDIRIAHYPPHTSKWNPIEHRLFPHITRSLSGILLNGHDLVKQLIKKTVTEPGLKVKANIIDKVYETGKKVSEEFKNNMEIIFDEYLPQWNYTAKCKK